MCNLEVCTFISCCIVTCLYIYIYFARTCFCLNMQKSSDLSRHDGIASLTYVSLCVIWMQYVRTYIYIYYTHYPFVNTSTTTIRHGMCHILSRIWSCTVHMSSNITSSQPNTITWHLYRISSSITTTTMAKPVEWLIHLPFQSLCPSCLVWL